MIEVFMVRLFSLFLVSIAPLPFIFSEIITKDQKAAGMMIT
jgi:hypothetical protein